MRALLPEEERYWWNAPSWLRDRVEKIERDNRRLEEQFESAVAALRTAQTLVQAKGAREVWIYLEGEIQRLESNPASEPEKS